ncbi:uncharacterized protein LOC129585680 isoform X1 [Paramacrobiotus metropolitanus]|uniref:uncharacterized protein LOC129585680 isoform X1 n=1 Tax=Paramacrobiotus metropolitanus TaxID=2943436 RepID=UPI002445B046|nr:uncharacterized protein LOC129585680 isoform X1 [Paramacrobiotus metropolitanus]
MADKRGASRAPRKGQKDNDEKRTVDSIATRKTLPIESQEYQCTGDFVDDFRQTTHAAGIPVEELPHLIHKPYYSLWRNIELPAPAAPVLNTARMSTSPSPEVMKVGKGGASSKGEPGSKSSLLDSANAKGRDKEKLGKEAANKTDKDKVKKKVSKITTGPLKSDAVTPKIDQRSTVSTENMTGRGGLDPKKPADRLLTSKGRDKDKNMAKEKADELPLQQLPVWPALEGNDQKPLYVVYDAFLLNRIKEICIRGWSIDRVMVDVLCRCWTVSDRLLTIILVDCGLKSSDIARLADAVPKILNLEFLALDGNLISEQNHGLVLSKPSSIRHLSVRYANLTDAALKFLAASWLLPAREWSSDRPGLEFLDLSQNRISDLGLQYLVQALRFNRSLVTLVLTGNLITDLGISIFCKDLLTRFALTQEEALDRRQSFLKYAPPVVNPVFYTLQRKYRFPQEANRDKSRTEKDAANIDSRKKDKEDNKKASSRMSGTRISAGNAVKTSPAPSGRVAGSAHPERTKTAAKGASVKQGASVIKNLAKFTPAISSHSQADKDLGEPGRADGNPPDDLTSQQRSVISTDMKLTHSTVPVRMVDQSDQDIHITHSPSHQEAHASKSFLEADGSEVLFSRSGLPNSVTSFIPNLDALHSGESAPDPRVLDLLLDLSRTDHHGELVLSDRDVWLDHSPIVLPVWTMDNIHNDQTGNGVIQGEDIRSRAEAYRKFLFRICYQLFDGSTDIRSLPAELLRDLVRLADDPLFPYPKGSKDSMDKDKVEPPENDLLVEAVDYVEKLSGTLVPKFHLHVTSASFTDTDATTKENQDRVTPSAIDVVTFDRESKSEKLPDADIKSSNTISEKSNEKPLAPQRLTKTASAHRKISLKNKTVKAKKGDTATPEIGAAPEQSPKECPAYNIVSVEERFNALIDGVIFDSSDGLISDGNRSLKVLNLSENKITVSGLHRLMEAVARQRKEQTESLLWKRPPSPALPTNTRLPPVDTNTQQESPESESTLVRKEGNSLSARADEKSQSGKKQAGKKAAQEGEASSSPLNAAEPEYGHVDNCVPVVIRKRIVEEKDDPNRKNIGLLYVDILDNPSLPKDSVAMVAFDRFMEHQREAYGIGRSGQEYEIKETDRKHNTDKEKENRKGSTVERPLMMGEYILERKNAGLFI